MGRFYIGFVVFQKVQIKSYKMRKALIPLFLALLMSCENKITEKGRNEALTNQTESQLQSNKQTTQNQVVSEPNYISDKKYSFVVFEGDGFFPMKDKKELLQAFLKPTLLWIKTKNIRFWTKHNKNL